MSVLDTNQFEQQARLTLHPVDAAKAERILVVDDDEISRCLLEHALMRHGYETVSASSAAEALEAVSTEHPDLVLLDISMPLRDGLEVLDDVRRTRSSSELPILMVTADHHRDQVIRAFSQGANDYLVKPIDLEIALARIKTHLRLKSTLERLSDSEERYALAVQGANDGIWDWNLRTNEIYFSRRWKAMLGLPQDAELTTDQWWNRLHREDRDRVMRELQGHLRGETRQFETELRILHESGGYRWMLCRGMAIRNADGAPCRIAGSLTDVNEGKVADPLTDLPNRLLFTDRLKRCVEDFQRCGANRFAVIYLDLDNFKMVNDSLGHECGDELLVLAARRLRRAVRSSEGLLARMGGDEFAILLEPPIEESTPLAMANRVLDCLESPFRLKCGEEVFASASLGISVAADRQCKAEDILREADTSMNQAKSEGKSCYRVYNPGMHQRLRSRLQLESEFRQAVQRDEFLVYFQPVIELQSRRIVGFEALARWRHPQRGIVGPQEFIPIAEETGLMTPLGRRILQKSCQQLADWRAAHRLFESIQVSVNVSSRQFAHGDLAANVLDVLQSTALEPRQLRLEVTESTLMENPETAAEQLDLLRGHGVSVAVDDFGTGYSSLAYLHRLPLDALKIDRTFVSQLQEQGPRATIAETIVRLADGLRLELIAEGIETDWQWRRLVRMGCQYGQGYLFSPPLPPQAALEWFSAQRWSEDCALLQNGPADNG